MNFFSKCFVYVILVLSGLFCSFTNSNNHKSVYKNYLVNYDGPTLTNPVDGAINVSVNSSISWTPVQGVDGYIISLGTSPGSKDLIADQMIGTVTTFVPPVGLPSNSTIYVNISLFYSNDPNILCPEQSFSTENITIPPLCSILAIPQNGEGDVPVDVLLEWTRAFYAEGYIINIGTSSGINDIVDNLDVGNLLSYSHPGGLPALTTFYVRILPYNSNGFPTTCFEEIFTTSDISPLPLCTSLISPQNGESGVTLSRALIWNPVRNATGYRITIGSSLFDDDILSDVDVGNVTTISSINLVPNSDFFVTITPYNDAGKAVTCMTESFTTIFNCGPFLDPISGELISLKPELNFPEEIGLCPNLLPFEAIADTDADGYRWFQVGNDGTETLVSNDSVFNIFQEGNYRVEAFNNIVESNFECSTSQNFSVVASEPPIIENINLQPTSTGAIAIISVSGRGNYDFALNNRNGPYQENPIFEIDINRSNIIYIRDRNGCGIFERFINTGLPNFFTPNGDTFNDFWQIPGATIDGEAVSSISIFNRFGKIIAQLNPKSKGWDGTYLGNPMPPNDYWYRIELENGKVLRGHFALRR